MFFENLAIALPQYLSDGEQKNLLSALQEFPYNIDARIYSTAHLNGCEIYQGDGIKGLKVFQSDRAEVQDMLCIVLSNTCDISLDNNRMFAPNILYAPIFKLEKYKDILINKYGSGRVINHIAAIKNQEISQIFYLPVGAGLVDESIVFLDRITNWPLSDVAIHSVNDNRLFSLSDFGFYVLLYKLSVHFTRMRECVFRSSSRKAPVDTEQ